MSDHEDTVRELIMDIRDWDPEERLRALLEILVLETARLRDDLAEHAASLSKDIESLEKTVRIS